jgi:hypothetical protein
MTLAIHTRVTGQNLQFNYQDAVVEGDYVFLGRVQGAMAEVWLRCNVDSEATEGDWIYYFVKLFFAQCHPFGGLRAGSELSIPRGGVRQGNELLLMSC